MPIEKRPTLPLPSDFVPPDSRPYRVKDGDNWIDLARANSMEPWDLIFANFRTRDPAEVNWYLHHYTGCVLPTADGRNWRFSSGAKPGIIHIPVRVIRMPPVTVISASPSGLRNAWAGLGKAHSGDLFVIGSHDLTAKLYNLGDDPRKVRNAVLNINGWKFGPGLGGSVGAVLVIAHGYDRAEDMVGVKGDWDFEISIGAKLGDFLKGTRGLGRAVDTYEKYKKLRYLTENAIKNAGILKSGIYTIPIPLAGAGMHLWGGYAFGDVSVFSTGVGVP